jgi:tetratricopeptide (TPR) repeat protein
LNRVAVTLAMTVSLAARAASAQDDDTRRERAKQLYDEGVKRYGHHEYDLAIDAFKSSYTLSGRANLLFNIAVAYDEWSGHCEDARDFYRRYLRAKPEATDRGDVDTRLARIEQICPSAPVAPVVVTPVVTPVLTPSPLSVPRRKLNAAPLVIATLGFVVAAGGAVTLGATAVKYGELTNAAPVPPAAWQAWQAASYVSYALLAAGGVVLASGLFWFAVHPAIGTSGAGVVVGAAF